MNICLINPPNCGRSIPEEEYGITSIKMIFRGEPLALESLAGVLVDHEVELIDLKVDTAGIDTLLDRDQLPDMIAFTAVTCEARTVCEIAARMKRVLKEKCPVIVVGGHHASTDPEYFNKKGIDYVVRGLARRSFKQLVDMLAKGKDVVDIPGVARTCVGDRLKFEVRRYDKCDLMDEYPPAYHLIEKNRDHYVMSGVGGKVGFVVTAFGCTHCCLFCSIPSLTGGRYLTHSLNAIIRDIQLLEDIPLIRFVDANTFGEEEITEQLARRILELGIKKRFVADVRADTVVKNPELMRLWKDAGLSAVVIGFEEIDNERLKSMNKESSYFQNLEALKILNEIGINVIGDFIISPDYDYSDFEKLAKFIDNSTISLPIPSILTPIPGTGLYSKMKNDIIITNLDYYTFSNAVVKTKLDTKEFYTLYSDLMKQLHQHISGNS